jgi:hypothetical protein
LSDEVSLIVLLQGIAIGVFVTAFGFVLAQVRDWRQSKRLHASQRTQAYSKMYAILERLGADASKSSLSISTEDFKDLQAAVEGNYDVLDKSTIEAWRARKLDPVIVSGYGKGFTLHAGPFFGNVRVKYERFDKRNPYYHLRNEDTEAKQET